MSGPRRRILAILVSAVVLLSGAVGCTGLSSSEVDSSPEQTIVPMVIKVAKTAVRLIPDKRVKVIAQVGVTGAASVANKWTKARNGTYLVVAQTVAGKYQATVFRVASQRKLRIDMNGRFIQEVERNLITITIPPSAEATIVVTDAESGDRLHREGKFRLIGFDGTAAIDLDNGELKNPKDDPELAKRADLRTGSFGKDWAARLINGAAVADWKGDKPVQGECMSLPDKEWKKAFVSGDWLALRPAFCLRTSEGRYGYLKGGIDLVTHSYVIWKKPDE